jgi:hypothetical protein
MRPAFVMNKGVNGAALPTNIIDNINYTTLLLSSLIISLIALIILWVIMNALNWK